jgi:hypothetical protein
LPSSLPLKAENEALAKMLGPMPKLEPGINIAAALAARDAAPRDPRDVGGMARDRLGAMSRLRDE